MQVPLEQTPVAQSLVLAQATQLLTPPVKAQCGFGLAQSVSVRHAWQTRKPRPPAKPIWTLPQYGKVAGQSVLAAHWVHVPIAHTLAVETSGIAAGHSAFVSQGRPLPEGASGIGGQAHCPHH